MPSTFQPYIAQHQSLTKFQSMFNRDEEPPIMSYEYTSTAADKLFHFASTLLNSDVSLFISLIHKLASVKNPT